MSTDYSGYVDPAYLDTASRLLSPAKRRTYELMELQEGQLVLDLGCEPGSDTIALAGLVGETGHVHGVDFDSEMVVEANERAHAAGVAAQVVHQQADAASLPFDDDFFDSCRSERVFQHLSDPAAGLAEMIRVTRPGGHIVVLDADYGSISIASGFPEIERRLAEHHPSMRRHTGRRPTVIFDHPHNYPSPAPQNPAGPSRLRGLCSTIFTCGDPFLCSPAWRRRSRHPARR